MKNATKRIFSLILALALFFCATVSTYAAEKSEKLYLSDLRIIYAQSYNEAVEILKGSAFEDYYIFNSNLNENTGKKGVWLAFKTTTDIEDAITDIAVMQMDGGYREGNYQEMIKQSYKEYVKFGETYLDAIEYFANAYNKGDFLARSAYRQLNLYSVKTEGIDDIPDFEGKLMGDIFLEGIDSSELATIFMEGNSYVLNNIRSLLAMGVSYNANGKHYLEIVSDEAAEMTANPGAYKNNDYDEIASLIAGNILTFKDMFSELAIYEDEFDYADDELTEKELEYAEYKSFADRMREVDYLDGKTLYDFCLEYKFDSKDLTTLYPLVAALNEGQKAMTLVSHYYDVVLYSMTDLPEEKIEAELNSLEETYAGVSFNVYAGVDRTIYRDTFALTGEAYRDDAYTESGFWGFFLNPTNAAGIATATTFSISLFCSVWAVCRSIKQSMMTNAANNLLEQAKFSFNEIILKATSTNITMKVPLISSSTEFLDKAGNMTVAGQTFGYNTDGLTVVNAIFKKVFPNVTANHEYSTKLLMLKSATGEARIGEMTNFEEAVIDNFIAKGLRDEDYYGFQRSLDSAKDTAAETAQKVSSMSKFTHALYVAGGISLLVSAITTGIGIYNYYNPTYDDIPTAMVDLINTADGDRYIKYDVVYEAEENKGGTYSAADLNAFQANRWNALYYTKSYEAGKPLLAHEFVVSTNNNTPDDKYSPVHRFGEVICFNLNKYNFNDDHTIYLSVKQSDNQKAATFVPEIVGSVFSTGYMFLSVGLGAGVGVGATFATQEILKRRKAKANLTPDIQAEE